MDPAEGKPFTSVTASYNNEPGRHCADK